MENYRLTQYSHGAGCGCKISPEILDSILHSNTVKIQCPELLVGNETKDDAAVYDSGDGTAIISTTDFFMPIVDDAVDFGRIASVNAISDVYAMGGIPLMAIAVLGWPVNTVPLEAARLVLEGSRMACADANIPLAGGHSIDSPEPIFGLAVTGRVPVKQLKKNSGATEGCSLYLTKPIGVGIMTTAQKKNILKEEHQFIARDIMVQLNKIGTAFGEFDFIKALTDVTGFGLAGHLIEMCEGSNLSAEIEFDDVPVIDKKILYPYIEQKSIPGGTGRNFESYGHKLSSLTDLQKTILCDPQTSGGLLAAVEHGRETEFENICNKHQLSVKPFGKFVSREDKLVSIS
jgi:selenide, water dikinase